MLFCGGGGVLQVDRHPQGVASENLFSFSSSSTALHSVFVLHKQSAQKNEGCHMA
jgi:hypothetical protein